MDPEFLAQVPSITVMIVFPLLDVDPGGWGPSCTGRCSVVTVYDHK